MRSHHPCKASPTRPIKRHELPTNRSLPALLRRNKQPLRLISVVRGNAVCARAGENACGGAAYDVAVAIGAAGWAVDDAGGA